MSDMLTRITDYQLLQSGQIAVVFVAVAAACWVLRNVSAHWRYLLWLLVLIKCAVPPLVSLPLAVLPESAPPVDNTAVPFSRPARGPRITTPPPESAAPGNTPAPLADAMLTPVEPLTATRPSAAPAAVGAVDARRVPQRTAKQWVALTWMAGLVLFLLAVGCKAWRIQRFIRRNRRPIPAALQAELEPLARALRLPLPRAFLINGMAQPFVWGLLRGAIYLPASFAQTGSAAHRRSVLMHELAHVARRDAAVNTFQIFVQAAFFFHPLVWWANRRIRQEREKCCDEVAIAYLEAPPRQYSEAIVNALVRGRGSNRDQSRLETSQQAAQPVPSLAVAGPVRNIEERINTIMQPNRRFHRRASRLAVVSVALLGALTLPTALVLTTQTASPQGPPTEAVPASQPAATQPPRESLDAHGLPYPHTGGSELAEPTRGADKPITWDDLRRHARSRLEELRKDYEDYIRRLAENLPSAAEIRKKIESDPEIQRLRERIRGLADDPDVQKSIRDLQKLHEDLVRQLGEELEKLEPYKREILDAARRHIDQAQRQLEELNRSLQQYRERSAPQTLPSVQKFLAPSPREPLRPGTPDAFRRQRDLLAREVDDANRALQAKIREIAEYTTTEPAIPGIRDQTSVITEHLLRLSAMRTEARARLPALKAQHEALQKSGVENIPVTPEIMIQVDNDPLILQLDLLRTKLIAEKHMVADKFGEEHANVRKLATEIAKTDVELKTQRIEKLRHYRQMQIERVRLDVVAAQDQLAYVESEYREAESAQLDLDRKRARLQQLEHEKAWAQERFDRARRALEALDLADTTQPDSD